MYAAHFQKTRRHKLFSKTTLLQKAPLKSLHSVLAKEERSLLLTGLCLVTALQWSLWFRLAPTQFRVSVSNHLRTVLPLSRVMFPLVMFAAVEGRMDQEDASCIYLWCERCWLSAEGRIWFNKQKVYSIPSLAQWITWMPTQLVEEAPWRVGNFTGSFRVKPQDKKLSLIFLFILVFVSPLFKYLDLKERPCWQQLLF